MSDDKKHRRPGSIMGDDARANQPRPEHPRKTPAPGVPVPEQVLVIEAFEPSPPEDFESATPPPVVVDDIGRAVTREAVKPYARARARKTIQEIMEELWPARKAMELLAEQHARLVGVETRVQDMVENGPAAVATAHIATVKAELNAALEKLSDNVERDLDDHRKIVAETEERATKADKFVRRVIYGAASGIGGIVVAAVMLIYQAGQRSEQAKSDALAQRVDLIHRIESAEQSLTDARAQVNLLLESRIGGHRP